MQVLWNGKGDFFLLLIFMLCIERLFHMINGVVEDHEYVNIVKICETCSVEM